MEARVQKGGVQQCGGMARPSFFPPHVDVPSFARGQHLSPGCAVLRWREEEGQPSELRENSPTRYLHTVYDTR